jgi:hypothetical protein
MMQAQVFRDEKNQLNIDTTKKLALLYSALMLQPLGASIDILTIRRSTLHACRVGNTARGRLGF